MNKRIFFIICLFAIILIPVFILSKRLAPTTDQQRIDELKVQFAQAVISEDWDVVKSLAQTQDSWVYIGDSVTEDENDTALRRAIRSGQFDLAQLIITKKGGFCSRQRELILELDQMIKDAQKTLDMLRRANSICI